MRFLVFAAVVAGCSAGPDPVRQEQVMARVWDQFMGMESGSRPQIEWLPADCSGPACNLYKLNDQGRARVNWYGSFHDSEGFALTLVDWKSYLMTSYWFPDDELVQFKAVQDLLLAESY